MLINLNIIFEEFCDSYCPNQETKKIYEQYGRECPNCLAESYHYWLLKRLEDSFNKYSKEEAHL